MDENQLDMWYHVGSYLRYAYTTDPDLQTWVLAPENDLDGYYYPYVAKHPTNGNYYLITQENFNGIGDLYMFVSSDKRTWTIMNGGNPVLNHSATETDWNYHLYNPSILFKDGNIILCIEGQSETEVLGSYKTAVSISDLDTLNFNTNFTKIIDIAGGFANPDLKYLPERNSYLLVGSTFNSNSHQETRIWIAFAGDNIIDPNSWIQSKFKFTHSDCHTSDPYLIELFPYFNKKLLLSYNYDQSGTNTEGIQPNSLRQAFSNLTLTELYDRLIRDL